MSIKSLKKSTKLINGRFLSEASGNINRSNIQQVAKTGVNRISLGAITHSSPTFDFSLEVEHNH
jgi:nicotinate-nucleotide pyrophosphorylase (carboxylating)